MVWFLFPRPTPAALRGSYAIECPTGASFAVVIPPGDMTQPLLICGTGNGTTLELIKNSDGLGGNLFQIDANPWVAFQDLTVTYNQTSEHHLSGTAFSFNAGAGSEPPPNMGYRLFRVKIKDCANPVSFNGNPSIATVRDCEMRYSASYPTDLETIGISISGGPVVVDHCLLILYQGGRDVATTGVVIQNVAAGTTTSGVSVINTHIDVFQTSIAISATEGAVAGVVFESVTAASPASCVNVQGIDVSDVSFSNCHFQAGQTSGSPGPGILVGTAGDANDEIDSLRLEWCTVSGFEGNGLEIQSGQNIQVTGGSYSGNGYDGGAGIAIVGASEEVKLDGVNCIGPIAPLVSVLGETTTPS